MSSLFDKYNFITLLKELDNVFVDKNKCLKLTKPNTYHIQSQNGRLHINIYPNSYTRIDGGVTQITIDTIKIDQRFKNKNSKIFIQFETTANNDASINFKDKIKWKSNIKFVKNQIYLIELNCNNFGIFGEIYHFAKE